MSTRRWIGGATATAQATTLTVVDTWASNDELTLTINNKTISMDIGTYSTLADIASKIAAAINGDAVIGNESRTATGDEIAEFREVTASADGPVVTVTGVTAGKPFTLTDTETTAGDGTISSSTTAATGPNHFSQANNWTGNTVPVDTDTVVFDSGDVDCLYGLAQSAVTPTNIIITQGYTGKIGLPEYNEDDSAWPYKEYRETYLALGVSTDSTNMNVQIGSGEGAGSERIKLDFGSSQATISIYNTGRRPDTATPPLLIKGTYASGNAIEVLRGDVGFAFYEGETFTVATMKVSFIDNEAGDAVVYCGSGCDMAYGASTLTMMGGTVETEIFVVALPATVVLLGGELINRSLATITTLTVDRGTVNYRGTGTVTTLSVGNAGKIDYSQDLSSRTVTNTSIYSGGVINDPGKTVTWTNGVDIYRCSLADVTINIGTHLTITPSAI